MKKMFLLGLVLLLPSLVIAGDATIQLPSVNGVDAFIIQDKYSSPLLKVKSNGMTTLSKGLKADFDSGWFAVSTPVADAKFVISHNMNAFPTRYQIFFSPTNPPVWIYPKSNGQSSAWNSTAGINWQAPHSIRFSTTAIEYNFVAGQAVGRYWDSTVPVWRQWNSGFMRILLWK